MTSLHPPYFTEQLHSKLPSHLFKRMGEKGGGVGWEVFPTTLLKLSQNWVIRIEKGGPYNFA